jgi:hypothetical protein
MEFPEDTPWRLVHGLVRAPDSVSAGHAWLENGSEAFDPVLNLTGQIQEYRTFVAATVLETFDQRQAAALVVEHRHYGPWSPNVKPGRRPRATSSR